MEQLEHTKFRFLFSVFVLLVFSFVPNQLVYEFPGPENTTASSAASKRQDSKRSYCTSGKESHFAASAGFCLMLTLACVLFCACTADSVV